MLLVQCTDIAQFISTVHRQYTGNTGTEHRPCIGSEQVTSSAQVIFGDKFAHSGACTPYTVQVTVQNRIRTLEWDRLMHRLCIGHAYRAVKGTLFHPGQYTLQGSSLLQFKAVPCYIARKHTVTLQGSTLLHCREAHCYITRQCRAVQRSAGWWREVQDVE